ncbi:MAG: hypothetical protein LGB67_01595 [Sulfurovum sp.]|nr:hypothetical protein [Sulfurovum sp.]MCB4765519.1 hypothetical protein [Sulfurovum sp.]MCB4766148.1 hypothetical protein [Sulfurovum sp.]
MQQTSLNAFLQDIKDIQEYIKHLELINQIEKDTKYFKSETLSNFNKHLSNFHTKKKLFEYKAITISLYGILEKYISIWIKEHIDNLKNIVDNYNDLPEKITQSHFDLSIKLIRTVSEKRYAKYNHLEKTELLKNLNICLEQPRNYKFNSDAFIPNSGNLKHRTIVESFKPLNITLSDILNKENEFPNFHLIDDLVTRRNDIAHGTTIDDILALSEFDTFIDFLKKYGEAIFKALDMKDIEYEIMHLYSKIEHVIDVYNNTILVFTIENNKIQIGDYIILKTNNGNFYKKKILSIEVDNTPISEYNTSDKKDIRINLGSGLRKNQIFYIKKRGL